MKEKVEDYCGFLKNIRNYSFHTISSYKKDLEQLVTYLKVDFEINEIGEVKSFMLRSYIANLSREGLAAKSINRKISSIKNFFKFLIAKDIIIVDPSLKLHSVKLPKRLPSVIGFDRIKRLFEDLTMDTTDFVQCRNVLIVKMFYLTGIRRSELIGLKLTDINDQRKELKVLGKGNKERILPVSNKLLFDIQTYIGLREKYAREYSNLFISERGTPLYPKAVYNIVKSELSKVTTADKRSPHILRHSFATHTLDEGADLNAIKEILGHANLSATQVYTHNSISKLLKVYKKAHPKAN